MTPLVSPPSLSQLADALRQDSALMRVQAQSLRALAELPPPYDRVVADRARRCERAADDLDAAADAVEAVTAAQVEARPEPRLPAQQNQPAPTDQERLT